MLESYPEPIIFLLLPEPITISPAPLMQEVCSWYEVMSYPTLKFFPPWAGEQELGTPRTSWDSTITGLKRDTILYLESIREEDIFTCCYFSPFLMK